MTTPVLTASSLPHAATSEGTELLPTVSCLLAMSSGIYSSDEMALLLSGAPRTGRWNGRTDRPWGLGDDYRPSLVRSKADLETIRMGKSTWFFRANGLRSYDTLREAFVGERLNGGREGCGCISAYAFGVATVDVDAQLEFLRSVMRSILAEAPELDLATLCGKLFGDQRIPCQHYLWWLEEQAFVAHPEGQERQDRLLLTQEGLAVLAMLEMTAAGSNYDLSPRAVQQMRYREGLPSDADQPRFLHPRSIARQ